VLPITRYLPSINELLANHPSLVLEAEPGAGKSTAVPLALLSAPWLEGKKILMLEPRRVAVKSIAYYLAAQLGEPVGKRIGYQIRNESKRSAETQLEIVTEGILTRRIQQDPELSDIGLIIFDEFHERSIHADMGLTLSLEVQQSLRDDLRLLVMSASMDANMVSDYLLNAPIISCEGRTFPVDITHLSFAKSPIVEQVCKACEHALSASKRGDILVFLPGQGDIERAKEALQMQLNSRVEVVTLYGAMPLAEQTKVLTGGAEGSQRIILATNIAETSLTIPNVTVVIDSGIERKLSFDVKSGLSKLVTQRIAKSSAVQRAGRAGRTQAGQCYRLWTPAEHQTLADFPIEEIQVTDLSNLVLEFATWGVTQFEDVNWLTAPPRQHFDVAQALNRDLGLLNALGKPTELGLSAQQCATEPRFAAMLLGAKEAIKPLAVAINALLSERDVLVEPQSARIADRLHVLFDYMRSNKVYGVRQSVLSQVSALVKKQTKIGQSQFELSNEVLSQSIAELVFLAFPDRLAKQSPSDPLRYTMANGRGVKLKSDDPLQKSPWLVVADCDGQQKDGLIFLAEPLSETLVTNLVKLNCDTVEVWQIDKEQEKLKGRRETKYKQLITKTEVLPTPSAADFKACLPSLLKTEGLALLNWTEGCERWLARVEWLAKYNESFKTITRQSLVEQVETWLLPYLSSVSSIRALKQVNIFELLKSTLAWELQTLLGKEAPEYYQTPSGRSVKVEYSEAGPTVSVKLQEVFGEVASPLLAFGAVKLRFELLSPAQRPLQVTSDLANFWRNAYVEVAKEMRGRYPKHRWPDEPWAEVAGHSLKSKMPK
jgi:ATP-dependent helicase HrpB